MIRPRQIVLGVVISVVVLAGGAAILFPLETRMATRRMDLYFEGVREFHAGEYSGFVRDMCDPHDPEARGCTCVMLLHGLGDDATSWRKLLDAPKSMWYKPLRLYAPEIARNSRLDPRDPPSKYRIRIQAQDIASALGPLCPSWVVVGNSLGGAEAAWIALEGKLKVEKLLLVDAAGTRASKLSEVVELYAHPTRESMRDFFSRVYFKPPKMPDLVLDQVAGVFTKERLGETIRAQVPEDALDGRLTTLRLPVMVIWGAGDRLLPDSIGKEMKAQIPSSIWREIPECGHLPQKECPIPLMQAINDMIRVGTM